MRLNFDRVVSASRSPRGVICNGVLVANIAGNFGSDRIDVLQRTREKGDSSCLAGERLQVTSGMPRLVAAKEQTDGIDNPDVSVVALVCLRRNSPP
jgi:hypothetical protein